MQTDFEREKILFKLSIGRIPFLSFKEKQKLKQEIKSSQELAEITVGDIHRITGKNISSRIVWNGKENLRMAQISLQHCSMLKIVPLFYDDLAYPELLRQIDNPPFVLFCKGNLEILGERSVSVVGTRKITYEGKKAALDFASKAALDGCNVVSGLAYGVDEYAHQGAINAWFDAVESKKETTFLGRTIAVLPSAVDNILPKGHGRLAENILKSGGCLISEYEPGMPIQKWFYVGRNRIIAALSPATVVIEAHAGSGSLITADFAVDYNRDLMFHGAGFGTLSQQVSQKVSDELDKAYAEGKISKYKRENTPEKYLEDGAPVIYSYEDYCKCLLEPPGTRFVKEKQGELFENTK